ncbi:hypothetical protein RFI_38628 [Reticulomyxa filosa]|uniref:JmjC domain-containing protein n=1 Tax=Reticulomyxa filosa TaxID=46433 RepID=X6LBI0_RETFI|nr:hypothetical protein RFI_38628 [Reticulomyxa filosa]|eukprot:ETN98858.1 hypothetical protein RFI_38628 [Reticulomyxa filosa]
METFEPSPTGSVPDADANATLGNAQQVTLYPGSVLYFPSGMWHQVETLSEHSLSINLSLIPLTYGEFFQYVLGTAMQQIAELRMPMRMNNWDACQSHLQMCLDKFVEPLVARFKTYPTMMCPPSFAARVLNDSNVIPIDSFDFSVEMENCHISMPTPPDIDCTKDTLFVNPLSVLIPHRDIVSRPKSSKDETQSQEEQKFLEITEEDTNNDTEVDKEYILHLNFGEMGTFNSLSRAILLCESDISFEIIEWIRNRRKLHKNEFLISELINELKFTVEGLEDVPQQQFEETVVQCLKVLIYFGWLCMKDILITSTQTQKFCNKIFYVVNIFERKMIIFIQSDLICFSQSVGFFCEKIFKKIF